MLLSRRSICRVAEGSSSAFKAMATKAKKSGGGEGAARKATAGKQACEEETRGKAEREQTALARELPVSEIRQLKEPKSPMPAQHQRKPGLEVEAQSPTAIQSATLQGSRQTQTESGADHRRRFRHRARCGGPLCARGRRCRVHLSAAGGKRRAGNRRSDRSEEGRERDFNFG